MAAFYTRVFWKAFLSLFCALTIVAVLFYWTTVPMIDRLAFESESQAVLNLLETLVEIVEQSHDDIETWRASALDARKSQLRDLIALAASWADVLEREVEQGRLTQEAARERYLDWLRAARYGKDDYIWAIDMNVFIVAHPDPRLDRTDGSIPRDPDGAQIGGRIVERARESGQGFIRYRWHRLDRGDLVEKLTYFRRLPQWDFVIATGVYVDDIDAEAERMRDLLLESLRVHLGRIRLARSGYAFVMDEDRRLIVHPDRRLEGQPLSALPLSPNGQSLDVIFARAMQHPGTPVPYRWRGLDERLGFEHRKIAWLRYLPDEGWYLGATVFEEELKRTGSRLTQRLIGVALVGFVLLSLFAFFFLRDLTRPIQRLAVVAHRHVAGDLSALSDVRRNDEIGELADAFNQMVRRLREQIARLEERTHELHASEAKFRGLVEQSLAGIFVTQEGRFRYLNAGFARLHGYDDAEDMRERLSISDLLPDEETRDRLADLDRRLIAGEIPGAEVGFASRRRDGERLDLEASLRRFDYEGRPAVIGVAIDVTESRRAAHAREEALAAAEQLARLKSDLISNMSHELRTPLHGIVAMAQIALEAETQEKARKAMSRVRESGERLYALLTHLLDFSRLKTGKLDLEPRSVDLRDCIDESVAEIRQQAAAKGLTFACTLDPDLPIRYLGDSARLEQILQVLLDNALKFTDQGRIDLRVRREEPNLIFEVADTGIGMAKEQLSGLFRPFEQMDASSTRRYSGVGLGLALAQRLAALMGGTLGVESAPGQGSVFRLCIPESASSSAAPPGA
ncbi:cache domain-containing protein [Imhoffiella purpurea]|uniref:histidine kinase n=1 Tax=Imhoffiella purpurea TaxID=1249627 RepID=W9V552_9GAMM|nr:cache domain-containing protein [Imhoffiella purpurea]EXJ14444.1 hypothetical protein D779_2585 [Imhoffiella purpurea]